MARMLGRIAIGYDYDLGTTRDTRRRKRIEQRDLGREFAAYADEAAEWAELTLPTALEGWPKT